VIETQSPHDLGLDRGRSDSPPRSTVEARRERLEQLQVVEVHLQTAAVLETRAERTVNATFAAVLRERAGHHRRTAARVFENLALRGHVAYPSRRRPAR
jgi:hypothetical protein